MFKFKTPTDASYQDVLERARRVNGVRQELLALAQGPMLEFADAAALGVAVDREIARQRSVAESRTVRVRAHA